MGTPIQYTQKTYAGLRDAYLYAGRRPCPPDVVALTDWMMDITAGLTRTTNARHAPQRTRRTERNFR